MLIIEGDVGTVYILFGEGRDGFPMPLDVCFYDILGILVFGLKDGLERDWYLVMKKCLFGVVFADHVELMEVAKSLPSGATEVYSAFSMESIHPKEIIMIIYLLSINTSNSHGQ